MTSNILAVGDSFTYGEELADRENAWPSLVAKQLNFTVNNMGAPGGGNTRIMRNIIENATTNDIVVAGLTSPGRLEFADTDGIFDIWPGYQGKWIHHPWRKTLTEYIDRHHDTEYIYKQYLINVIAMQSYLKSNGIKYLMMIVVDNEFYKKTYRDKFNELRLKIDTSVFIKPGSGMAEWTHGCAKGPNGHFLDDGHRIVANNVIEKIKEMEWA